MADEKRGFTFPSISLKYFKEIPSIPLYISANLRLLTFVNMMYPSIGYG